MHLSTLGGDDEMSLRELLGLVSASQQFPNRGQITLQGLSKFNATNRDIGSGSNLSELINGIDLIVV